MAVVARPTQEGDRARQRARLMPRGAVPSPRQEELRRLGLLPEVTDDAPALEVVDGDLDDLEPEASEAGPRTRRERLLNMVRELNPKHVCHGYPATPMVVIAINGALLTLYGQGLQLFLPDITPLLGTANTIVLNSIIGGMTQGLNGFGGIGLGYVADRWVPRVWFLRVGYMLAALLGMLTGCVTSGIQYILFASLRGIGIGISTPGQALIADYYPTDVRVRQGYFSGKVNQMATLIGPLIAATLVVRLGWGWSLIIFGLLSLFGAVGFFFVKEQPRGAMDRALAGASAEEIAQERPPVGFAEALRVLWSIRTLRYLYIASPIATIGGATLLTGSGIFFYETYHLGDFARALILSAGALTALISLTLQGDIQARLSSYRPGRLLYVAGLFLLAMLLLDCVMIFSTSLAMTVAIFCLLSACFAMIPLTIQSMFQIVLPSRVRALGIEFQSTFLMITVLWGPIALTLSNFLGPWMTSVGLDPTVLTFVLPTPLMVVGIILLFRGGSRVDSDMRNMLAASMAEEESAASRAAGRNKMIICRDVDVVYDGAQVLFNVDFDVAEGEIIALLGTNGAGKSTLLRAIAGIQQASHGAVYLDGEDITHAPPHVNARKGVVMVPGGRAIFPTLTVEENLRAAAWLYREDEAYVAERVEEVLGYFPRLRERYHTHAGDMSGGEQQMLALSQAFLMKPRLLMIDELSLGLAPAVVDMLLDIVRRINAQGTTVILVEQSVNVALSIARRCVFMEKGEVRFDGPTSQLLEHREILRSVFLGESRGVASMGSGAGAIRRSAVEERPVVLEVRDLVVNYGGVRALNGATLEVREGEILGIVGSNGAGKTTLFDVVSGFTPAASGSVVIKGNDATALSPDARARLGLSRSFQNARLFGALTVRDNVMVAMERVLESKSAVAALLGTPGYRAGERRAQRRVDGLVESLGLQAYSNKFIRELSTGTRRIVDIACILAANPQILLLDEPSSGLAQAETEELGPFIGRISKEVGCAVVVIEHDMNLISAVSDRLVAMHLGNVLRTGLPREVLDDPEVSAALIGRATVAVNRSGELAAELVGAIRSHQE